MEREVSGYESSDDSANVQVLFNNLDSNLKLKTDFSNKYMENKTQNNTYNSKENLTRIIFCLGLLCISLLLVLLTVMGKYISNGNQNCALNYKVLERCPGRDWVEYKDSKCFKLVKSFVKFSEASIACNKESDGNYMATTAIIDSKEEQEFLNNFIYNESDVQTSVWIGLSKKNENFIWADGSMPIFTNWPNDHPTNQKENKCVEIVSKHSKFENGQWMDTSCKNGNFVLCEKFQFWTVYEAERALIKMREKTLNQFKQINMEFKDLKENNPIVENIKQKVDKIEANPIPIGFIYVQLKGQPEPSVTWPIVLWTEISSEYTGLFFRVVGGNSSKFGEIQDCDSPRLNSVESTGDGFVSSIGNPISISPGLWSKYIKTGSYGGSGLYTHFFVNKTETRPYNTAMRIWKRTG